MSYVVSWWTGETRQHRLYKDEDQARKHKAVMLARSAKLPKASLVPVRVIPENMWDTMAKLKANLDNDHCRHGTLRRLCVPCLS